MFWFTIQNRDDQNLQLERITVEPESVTLAVGQKYKFKAYGYDHQIKTELSCTWKVIPSDGGQIGPDGNFTAGNHPRPVAVVAEYNGLQAFSTVMLTWQLSPEIFDAGKFVDLLFGLP